MPEDVKIPLEMFYHWEATTPEQVFLRQPANLQWREYTWAEVADRVRRLALGEEASEGAAPEENGARASTTRSACSPRRARCRSGRRPGAEPRRCALGRLPAGPLSAMRCTAPRAAW